MLGDCSSELFQHNSLNTLSDTVAFPARLDRVDIENINIPKLLWLIAMTPDQIAVSQLELARLQLWITALAIFLGPLFGVVFTLWFQSKRDKTSAKRKLFIALMAERKLIVISPQITQALNTIDIVTQVATYDHHQNPSKR